jgi:uncharacterized repeat protein (TIGR01451 family)
MGLRIRRTLRLAAAAVAGLALLTPGSAAADTFTAGSLIIPMDTDFQDEGVFEAYGLVYDLLLNDIPVAWVIKSDKALGDADFTTTATDVRTMMDVGSHGYRGGPWVIDAADVDAATPIVEAWLDANPNTNVHEATADFDGDISRLLIAAPTIAMMADGNQKIARKYMQAAKIPDSQLDLAWSDDSPDMLDPAEVSGPDDLNHHDGALFDEDGDPVYCQFMSMHWGVKDAEQNPEVVAEVREFLTHPTHFFAECQAVNAFENLDPHGFYLTENGFEIGDGPNEYTFLQADEPFNQMDGPFESVGGSEPAYTLPQGDSYKASDIVMITEAGSPIGVNDVWMTGNLDGICPASGGCLTAGKVSYLGGHEYSTDVPISQNPDAMGTRLFLNSLFEAPCATLEGLPVITVDKSAPASVEEPTVVFTVDYKNEGPTTALAASLRDPLPAGTTFVEASEGGTLDGADVVWDLGNLGVGEGGQVSFTVTLDDIGEYKNVATLEYQVGLNLFTVDSNETATLYGVDATTSGGSSGGSDSASATATDSSASASGTSGSASGTGASDSETSGASDSSTDSTASSSATASSGVDSATTAGAGDDGDGSGCGCRGSDGDNGWLILGGLLLVARRRRGLREPA